MRLYAMMCATILAIQIQQVNALHFCAYGDSRTQPSEHLNVCTVIAAESPELLLHSGDLWDGYTSDQWRGHFQGLPALSSLLNANKILISRGNHESEDAVLAFTPTIVRNNSILYTAREGNCFFVSMGFDPGLNNSWLETQLASSEAQTADWRFVFAHKPVYSTGNHGGDGITSEGTNVSNFRALCDRYNVNVYFSGHDHLYERTHAIYGGQVVNSTDDILQDEGTVYIVTGGGGAPLYSVSSNWWTKTGVTNYHYCVLDAGTDSCVVTVKDNARELIDRFVIRRADPGPDNTPPQILQTSPSDTTYSTSVTLTAQTDEAAMLRWSLTDQPYAAMTNQFTNGEGTSQHSTTVTVAHGQSYTYYVRAIDDSGNATPSSTVISFFVDTTIELVSWNQNNYDAAGAGWLSGPAELGYGDGDEATTVSFGGNSSAKYATTYFRSEFQIGDPAALGALSLTIRFDDGAVVYVNGQEATRINMPTGEVTNETWAASTGSDNGEQTVSIPQALLRSGTNTIAVSIHQAGGTSSDISFDCSLSGGGSTQIARGATWYYWDQGTSPASMLFHGNTAVTMHVPKIMDLVTDEMKATVTNGFAVFHLAAPSATDGILQLYDSKGRIVAFCYVPKNSIRSAIPTHGMAFGVYVAALDLDQSNIRVPLTIDAR